MVKYRKLSIEELESLKEDFVNFLVLNGIIGEDWQKMKDNDPDGAIKMTELFSDVVWESILRKINYLDFISPNSIKCFHCQKDKIVLVGVDSTVTDMSTESFSKLPSNQYPDDVTVYTTEKEYGKERESELFDMINWGCTITDGELYKALCLAL